jgi:ABC-type multidrug transport system ATPase subunit
VQIKIENISKKFQKIQIFSALSFEFSTPHHYGIIGGNGSGKSSLLKVLAGYATPNQGSISYTNIDKYIPVEDIYQHLMISAPYIDLIEDFSIVEQIDFHFRFKKVIEGISKEDIIAELGFDTSKYIKTYSSGMKQKLKLALGFYSQCDILLIDEPTSFLDKNAIEWFHSKIATLKRDKIVIIASNDKNDLVSCSEIINIENYKST